MTTAVASLLQASCVRRVVVIRRRPNSSCGCGCMFVRDTCCLRSPSSGWTMRHSKDTRARCSCGCGGMFVRDTCSRSTCGTAPRLSGVSAMRHDLVTSLRQRGQACTPGTIPSHVVSRFLIMLLVFLHAQPLAGSQRFGCHKIGSSWPSRLGKS